MSRRVNGPFGLDLAILLSEVMITGGGKQGRGKAKCFGAKVVGDGSSGRLRGDDGEHWGDDRWGWLITMGMSLWHGGQAIVSTSSSGKKPGRGGEELMWDDRLAFPASLPLQLRRENWLTVGEKGACWVQSSTKMKVVNKF